MFEAMLGNRCVIWADSPFEKALLAERQSRCPLEPVLGNHIAKRQHHFSKTLIFSFA